MNQCETQLILVSAILVVVGLVWMQYLQNKFHIQEVIDQPKSDIKLDQDDLSEFKKDDDIESSIESPIRADFDNSPKIYSSKKTFSNGEFNIIEEIGLSVGLDNKNTIDNTKDVSIDGQELPINTEKVAEAK